MAWTREMWEAMVTKGAKGSSTPWSRAPQSSGAGRNGLKQNLSLNPQRFVNDRLSNLSQNTQDQAVKALGLSSVNSMNDVNKIFEWVNDPSRRKVEEEQAPTDDPNAGGNSGGGRNEPKVNYNPSATNVPGENQGSYGPSTETGPSSLDPNNLNRWGVNANRFGMRDLLGAYSSGYTSSDVNNWLSTQTAGGPGQGNYTKTAPWYQGMQEIASGQVSTKFFNPDVAAYDPGGNGGTDFFSRDDLLANRKGGLSDYQILSWLDTNQDKLRAKNKKGVAGGIYEELNALRPKDPKNLLTGGSNLGNAGYADAVKPNRSKASSSSYSSYGTSQYNRDNFGNKKKSGVTVASGLNI